MPCASTTTIVSKCTIYPHQKSAIKTLKLSVSDLPMLSCQYIQKGVLLSYPPYSIKDLITCLKHSLSVTLTHFPPLAGRLITDQNGHVHILCNDDGVEFIQAKALHLLVNSILSPLDVPNCFKEFFAFDKTLSYSGHSKPLVAVQVTELADGIFIGCTVNHAVVDGTSLWHFFNTFAEFCKGVKKISNSPDFSRTSVFNSPAVLRFPPGGPEVTFSGNEPLRERIFHFSRESIQKLKFRANHNLISGILGNGYSNGKCNNGNTNRKHETAEVGNCNNGNTNGKHETAEVGNCNNGNTNGKHETAEVSSFQSLCAQLWRSVTRVRNLHFSKTTTFRMAVNCRHRLKSRLDPYYFGNAIQSIPTVASVGELLSRDLSYGAELLHRNVVAHDDSTVRKGIASWERKPRLFPLGNPDGASITMGSSPRFPMYDNDFGWGRPLAVRSGGTNKFDGKISAFPGRDGAGSVDLEVLLAPETMAGLESDGEFMQYVSVTM